MKRRQTLPRQWLIINEQPDDDQWRAVRRLPRGSGVLVLVELSASERRRLRHLGMLRALIVSDEAHWTAARVHNSRELSQAMLRRTPLILLSPLYRSASHPDWPPLPRMRAAALARLGGRRLFALGGMTAQRFARIRPFGFQGWAGIGAFRT
jgi:thiamine-phosphate pyrophosphorylase